MRDRITPQRAREIFSYNCETGEIVRIKKTGPRTAVGSVRNNKDRNGYILLKADGRTYPAHRVAWAIHHNEWPSARIDHKNGDPADNRIKNLRLATQSQNIANARRRSDNKSGQKGVRLTPGGKFKASIVVGGKRIHLGNFSTIEEAATAYAKAAKLVFGEFSRCE